MGTLRVGILGSGGIAARHASAVASLPEQMRLVAVSGRNESTVAELAARFGAECFSDFSRMLDTQELDLLIVALPPHAHSGQVEAAAAAGVHLLVEKPIALEMQSADSMVSVARQAGVVAACGFMYRFGDAVRRWEHAVAAGLTGRPGLFAGQFHCNALHAPWWRERSRSGGQLVEQLIHILDLARHHLGEPHSVYARTSNFFHGTVERYDSDDVSALVLGYEDGRVAVLNASNGAVPGRWEKNWQIVAERMTGRFTGWNSAVLTRTDGDSGAIERIETTTDVFVAQLADVAAAIAERRPPRVPLEDGAKTLRIALAAARSSAERRELPL